MVKKTFYEFMLQYKGKDTPRGDLARDMIRLQTWYPEDGDLNRIDSLHILMCYLSAHGACQACCEAAESCWSSYENYLASVC